MEFGEAWKQWLVDWNGEGRILEKEVDNYNETDNGELGEEKQVNIAIGQEN